MYKIKLINMMCIIILCLIVIVPIYSWGEILFTTNFDNYQDWSPMQGTAYYSCSSYSWSEQCIPPPPGFSGYNVQGTFYTSPGHNTLNIDSTNHRGATGKALTYWNESNGGGGEWASDGMLFIHLNSTGYEELYVRFYIKFQPGWQWSTSAEPMQKFFRITNYDGIGSPFKFFQDGSHHPAFFADLAKFNNGNADIVYRSAYRYENIYYPSSATPSHSSADNFYFGDGNYSGTGTDFGNQGMMGDGNWHSWEFYVKINSAVGVPDGIHRFWQDGKLIAEVTDLAWADEGAQLTPRKLWNFVALGGNNFNQFAMVSSEQEQWYAIDDLVISTSYIGPESVPVGGYDQANVIPAGQVSQAKDGSGTVTINFKVLDEYDNTPITLSNFEYSTDGGSTWVAPTDGDGSAALSSNWADNSYLSGQYSVVNGTSAEWSAAIAYSFTLNTKHADVAPLNQYEGNVKFRFYVNNGNPTPSNDPVQTESFILDNMPPVKIDPTPSIN